MAKRGRPVLAAQSFEAAFQAVENGTAPKRARNHHERMAASKTRGRRPSPASKTRIAAELAAYLMHAEGCAQAEAVRQACAAAMPLRVDASNVRKYLKRMSPVVLSAHSRRGLFSGFPVPVPELLPLLHSVESFE